MRKKYSARTKRTRRAAFKKAARLNAAYFLLGLSFTVVGLIKSGCLPTDFLGFTISPF